jgi:hypothetical protein
MVVFLFKKNIFSNIIIISHSMICHQSTFMVRLNCTSHFKFLIIDEKQ